MNLQGLRHFVAVAAQGSLGQASETLNISQTGLTKSIQRLEESIGGSLFHRSAKGMTLTQAGETLLPHAQLLLSQAGRAKQAVTDQIGGREGRIAIGAAPEWLRFGVEPALLALRQSHPGVQIFLASGRNTRSLVADLRHGELDFVVGVTQLDEMTDLRFDPMAANRQGIIVAQDHPLRHRPPASLADLSAYQWILPTRKTLFRARLDEMFRAQNLPAPRPGMETNFMPFVITCVGASDMLGTATDALIAAHSGPGVAFLQVGSIMERPMGVLSRAGEPVSALQSAFIAELRRHVATQEGQK